MVPSALGCHPAFICLGIPYLHSLLDQRNRIEATMLMLEPSRSWLTHLDCGHFTFMTFSCVFAGLLFWARIQQFHGLKQILNAGHWPHKLFDGVILGLAMMGATVVLRNHFPQARRFSLLMMAVVSSSSVMRTALLLLIVFTEELWRAVCLQSLMGNGLTGPLALIATSIAYGLTYLVWDYAVAVSELIVGAILAGLFIWTNSFVVLFAAHLTLLGQILLLALAAAPDAGPGDFHRRPFRRCPSCRAMLSLQEVNTNPDEAFSCPHCHVGITISDWRGAFFRWGYGLYAFVLYFGSVDIMDKVTKNPAAHSYSYPSS